MTQTELIILGVGLFIMFIGWALYVKEKHKSGASSTASSVLADITNVATTITSSADVNSLQGQLKAVQDAIDASLAMKQKIDDFHKGLVELAAKLKPTVTT